MVTKVSEISVDDIVNYLRLSDVDDKDRKYLETIKNVSLDYIKNHTGLKKDEMDKHSDLAIVVFVLCQDMYDNRSLYVDKNNVNKVVSSILGMHDYNLL